MHPTDSTSRTIIVITLLAVLAACVWLIRDVLPPFLISIALAMLFDPVIDRMEARGLPRGLAVALAFFVVLALGAGLMMAIVPRAIGQIADLTGNLDAYGARLVSSIDGWAQRNAGLLQRAGLPTSVGDVWSSHQAEITRTLQGALQGAFASLQSFAGALGWFLVIPIVTLYLMMDVDALRARCHYLVPPQHRTLAGEMSGQVSRVFAAYLRGLTMICLSFGLGIWLVLGGMFRLPYAVILALLAVVLYAIPYLGQIALLLAAVLVAWATGHATPYVIAVGVAVLLIGQLFDQLITPRVMGKQVGLHPVLGVFALMVGGHLFGLPGMVIAVPAAASIRVVLIELFPRLAEPLPGSKADKARRAPEPEQPTGE